MPRKLFVFILVLVWLLSACSGPVAPQATVEVVGNTVSAATGSNYTDISAAELHKMLTSKDFTLVNVHIPFEGKIEGTDLFIPYDQIAQNLDKLPDKSAKIVLYCRSGRMSSMAAEALVKSGYTNILNLSGGMLAWEQAGFKIEN